ncbi:DUF397 domain-containing protein [Allostreptomyces psammosilenae]|uniref:DUF397 domain-containing protein n=1 Tax=Allostreptomyces psammosilenae TaxID=1892865 RepID=UPI0028AC4038|nr:DUF397 domain-containing protein [Allostreptomyces psammosilenae]
MSITNASSIGASWRRSSYSGGSQGECVEWAPGVVPNVIPVRDSKNPDGPALTFSSEAWRAFVGAVKAGHISRGSA